jgi:FtsP/CotA-like multicopper oxidase with cupredoxin domain
MLKLAGVGLVVFGVIFAPICAHAQSGVRSDCPRPAVSSTVTEPNDLRSRNGELRVALSFHQSVDSKGSIRYCYLSEDGSQAPTLRVKPGDLVILTLQNDLPPHPRHSDSMAPSTANAMNHGAAISGACAGGGEMSVVATNLHFHGLSIPATCHQDDVLRTSVLPGDPPFEYRFRIPVDQPPGLYWYHPHLHGFSKVQVLGGA